MPIKKRMLNHEKSLSYSIFWDSNQGDAEQVYQYLVDIQARLSIIIGDFQRGSHVFTQLKDVECLIHEFFQRFEEE